MKKIVFLTGVLFFSGVTGLDANEVFRQLFNIQGCYPRDIASKATGLIKQLGNNLDLIGNGDFLEQFFALSNMANKSDAVRTPSSGRAVPPPPGATFRAPSSGRAVPPPKRELGEFLRPLVNFQEHYPTIAAEAALLFEELERNPEKTEEEDFLARFTQLVNKSYDIDSPRTDATEFAPPPYFDEDLRAPVATFGTPSGTFDAPPPQSPDKSFSQAKANVLRMKNTAPDGQLRSRADEILQQLQNPSDVSRLEDDISILEEEVLFAVRERKRAERENREKLKGMKLIKINFKIQGEIYETLAAFASVSEDFSKWKTFFENKNMGAIRGFLVSKCDKVLDLDDIRVTLSGLVSKIDIKNIPATLLFRQFVTVINNNVTENGARSLMYGMFEGFLDQAIQNSVDFDPALCGAIVKTLRLFPQFWS
ncbi:MAG: hypothetical protein LBJ96_01600 [Holosporaceae bacterium]|jgi:uncharacterized tellurite resistance protein B-like protein|nr:hypothetical protein [Holosporaceae bacterium]